MPKLLAGARLQDGIEAIERSRKAPLDQPRHPKSVIALMWRAKNSSLFNDAPLIHHNNFVCDSSNGPQVVRDEQI
ncbi:hypothetical protein NKJ50_31900 [Mesorhizobium sp. M0115]|uniref:hypothetical protein n=1 Tax=Mesorhizobium sp. M0115 TaxID=2956883 RepID=UPI003335A43B